MYISLKNFIKFLFENSLKTCFVNFRNHIFEEFRVLRIRAKKYKSFDSSWISYCVVILNWISTKLFDPQYEF